MRLMESITATDFWNSIDMRLDACGENLTSMADKTGIKYKTLSMQRTRHALPGIEQLSSMAVFFRVTLDDLIMGKNIGEFAKREKDEYPPRIQTIADHCLTASEDDLRLVEKVLGIVHEDKKAESSSALA